MGGEGGKSGAECPKKATFCEGIFNLEGVL
jgi:hypothetical protein